MNYKQMQKELAGMKRSLRPTRLRGLVGFSLTAAERARMKPGDRIVKDHYCDADGESRISNERITADPADEGKDFPDGTWDRAYWEANPPQVDRITFRTEVRPRPTPIEPKSQPEEVEAAS
jgi:hypothetical protein